MAAPNNEEISGLAIWRTWNTHYRRSKITVDSTKKDKLRARQASKRNWKEIGNGDRNEHVRLRRILYNAIHLAGVSEVNAENIDTNYQAEQQASRWQLREQIDSTEDLLRAKLQYLENVRALVRVEAEFSPLADELKEYDEGTRAIELGERIDAIVKILANLRNAEMAQSDSDLEEAIAARRNGFLRQGFDQGDDNTFVPLDGGNRHSKLGIWLQSDANRRIIDRVVVKDACYDQIPKSWSDEVIWQNRGNPLKKELVEAVITRKLQETGSPNVVRLRSSSLHIFEMVFRMLIEWCPHGDLTDIYESHHIMDAPIPEPLIWHLFESLVNVGILMEQGDLTQPQPEWNEIVHMDIKPANVFVGLHPESAPTQDNWPAYPTFKLGDYGLAFETWEDDDRNPHKQGNCGTERYEAPEQITDEENPQKLTAKTNVFGVGITVMTMMQRHELPGVKDKWSAARNGSKATKDHPHLNDDTKRDYSNTLVQLVSDSVRYDPEDRPSFQELRDAIRKHTRWDRDSSETDLAQGMRRSTDKQTYQLGLEKDRYRLGRDIDNLDDDSDEEPNDDEESNNAEAPVAAAGPGELDGDDI